ncbi:MAG: fructosamine kinase family protein [Lachnospiraceae bacterium]|nr:fructosamine kinase family protein [Lachnospiraceae bacterium]
MMEHCTQSIEDTLRNIFGENALITDRTPMTGSDLNRICRLTLSTGERVFAKYNSPERADMFRAEAEGLDAIRKTGCMPTPTVYGYGTDPDDNKAFILLEYLPQRRMQSAAAWQQFGRQLAEMHRSGAVLFSNGSKYGFRSDNYIGLSPQVNAGCGSWIDFFRTNRLEVQMRKGEHIFNKKQLKQFSYLLDHLDRWLQEPEFPSLLHGDLWGGNAMRCADGVIRLIDPAVYVGDREADLAMTELFGGFPQGFYEAYEEMSPLEPGYRDRRDLYNLYHLLNHMNLFGMGYLPEVLSVVNRYVGDPG